MHQKPPGPGEPLRQCNSPASIRAGLIWPVIYPVSLRGKTRSTNRMPFSCCPGAVEDDLKNAIFRQAVQTAAASPVTPQKYRSKPVLVETTPECANSGSSAALCWARCCSQQPRTQACRSSPVLPGLP